jgi:hypothetical protein
MTRPAGPDFLVMGAPKDGTTALHAALTQHTDIRMCQPKEPKYWICDDAPPPAWRGPGDQHSQQEWIWRRADYERLFAGDADDGRLRGESTPFYLWHRGAQRRIAEALPQARLIAVVRDPIDRAYSNWMHLWSDGLEPVADFEVAFARERERIDAGWAPFWRYAELGRYGEQLEHLLGLVDPERVLVLRYRSIVDDPRGVVDRTCEFLGIATGRVEAIPHDNARTFVRPGPRASALGRVVRSGAWLGQFAPPAVWRRASAPLIAGLGGRTETPRPRLAPEARARLLPAFTDDIKQLAAITGEDFGDWLSTESRGSFRERSGATAQSA